MGDRTVWMVTRTSDPLSWWHPVRGWVTEVAAALQLARKEDAETIISTASFFGVPVEHKF